MMLETQYAMKIKALVVTFLVWPLVSVSRRWTRGRRINLRSICSIHAQRNNVWSEVEV